MVEAFPLILFDWDADLFSVSDFSPSVWDGSEGEKSNWTVRELDLFGYGIPKAFLRRIPVEAKEWSRVKVEPSNQSTRTLPRRHQSPRHRSNRRTDRCTVCPWMGRSHPSASDLPKSAGYNGRREP